MSAFTTRDEFSDDETTDRMAVVPDPRLVAGRYELRGVLGTGGMSEVHLAYDMRLERLVALKLALPRLLAHDDFVARFRREAHILAQVESPNVVTVFDVSMDRELPYLVMRYIRGTSLSRVMSTGAPMEPFEAGRTVLQVLQGLVSIHAINIVHRDLKPSNIMITPEGHAVLVDLGIALDRRRHHLTHVGAVVGTPGYMAPEQAAGLRVDERVDLYQAGLLLAHLLMGRSSVPSDHELGRLPGGFGPIIARALAPVAVRYATASDMFDALIAQWRSL